jgi:hypothetical protein
MMASENEQQSTGRTRRHFLGLAAAVGSRVAAITAVMATSLPPSAAQAMGAKWWKKDRHGSPKCFLRGTGIRTSLGDVAIESLRIGDLIVTDRGEAMPVKWIGRRSYKLSQTLSTSAITPVRIAAHALGSNLPARDLYVSPGHLLLIDNVLIAAQDLVNDTSITRAVPAHVGTIEYFHVALDSHEAIYAEGALTETLLLEAGTHENFSNFAELSRVYPEGIETPMQCMAPKVGYGGRLHLKALLRLAFGRLVPTSEPAELIYEKIVERAV